ncbi:MAG: hypothetical protein V5B36_13140 [Candidatus Accumulibacter sp. UW25]
MFEAIGRVLDVAVADVQATVVALDPVGAGFEAQAGADALRAGAAAPAGQHRSTSWLPAARVTWLPCA